MSAYTLDDILPTPQRRIRHLTSIQICNLTPFPARDALAQTLTKPAPNSSSLPTQPADDIELTLASRRRRRVSANSIASIFNVGTEEEDSLNTAAGTLKQRRSGSKGSFQATRSGTSGSGTSTIRPRTRTSSRTSSIHLPPASPIERANSASSTDQDGSLIGSHFITHSQRALEKIVSSRLVETFMTLTLPPTVSTSRPPSQSSSLPSSPSANAVSARRGKDASAKRPIAASVPNHRRGMSLSSTSTHPTISPAPSKRTQSLVVPSPASSRSRSGPSGRASGSSRAANFPSPPPTPPPQPSPRHTSTPLPSTLRTTRRSETASTEHLPPLPLIPFYISPIHLPSTNPSFSYLDPEREFSPWADLSRSRVKVAIWGRGAERPIAVENGKEMKGKGKEKTFIDDSIAAQDPSPWKVLEEWDLDLDDMEPLSPDLAAHHLPSNTLLLTLSSGKTFHIPPVSSLSRPPSPSRAPSPVRPEHNSDGEVDELRRRRQERVAAHTWKRERETMEKSLRETRMKRSAGWQDLVKIVNLQTCVIDTNALLEEVVRNCDLLVEGDGHNTSLRELAEREEWVRNLRDERDQVLQDSTQVKDAIHTRREALKVRRDTLASVRALHKKDLEELALQAQEVHSERQRHTTLLSSLPPIRTALVQTVSFIFPIEPLSAPNLLFTILGAPLPLPLSSSDPAPPLSLPSHPEITEDSTGTALGYVAQVVQLISGYLGKDLVYPVTCCGSKSAVKDPISAMMGPRMFPLYSKGVETYRFEYGVFLLNKDIEMLMMDRNLRAIDMRHTLPNLKNLLLTLTTGEIARETRPTSPVSVAIISGVRSPTRAISPLALDSQSESQSQPVTVSADSRKSTPFLSPLAAILRARYPSSAGRPTVKAVTETPEPVIESDGDAEDGSQQPTETSSNILSVPTVGDAKLTVKTNGNNLHSRTEGPLEKLANAEAPPTPPPLHSIP